MMFETNNSIIKELSTDSIMEMITKVDDKLKYLNEHFISMTDNFKTGKEKMRGFVIKKEENVSKFDELENDIEKVINFIGEINKIMYFFSYRQSGGNIELVNDVGTTQKTEIIIHILIHAFTNKFRRWYTKDSNTSPYKKMFYNYYLIQNSIKIEKSKVVNECKKTRWKYGKKVALQICPAEKLCLFLIYVSLYEGVEVESALENNDVYHIDKLDLKIAAYALYVFLFNTWCACIMQQQWNSSVSNMKL